MLIKIGTHLSRHVVAYLALFFALGGTSLAAANRLAPRNSVGSPQVINGSLQTIDISRRAPGRRSGETAGHADYAD